MHSLTFKVSVLNLLKHLFVALFLIAAASSTLRAQVSFVRISVVSLDPARVKVELNGPGSSEWSFRNTYGAVVGLAERIENLQGRDNLGREVPEEN